MWVKICGITDLRAALDAAEAGADAVGFIFTPARRQMEPDQARDIVRRLPKDMEKVGVFVDATTDEIRRVADHVGLTTVQLHGREPVGLVRTLGGLAVVKAIRLGVAGGAAAAAAGDIIPWAAEARRGACTLLFEPHAPGSKGGAGQAWDWALARQVVDSLPGGGVGVPFILAGGLTPENVGRAIQQARPSGVDVSSGVETGGKKDRSKIRPFITAAKEAAPQ